MKSHYQDRRNFIVHQTHSSLVHLKHGDWNSYTTLSAESDHAPHTGRFSEINVTYRRVRGDIYRTGIEAYLLLSATQNNNPVLSKLAFDAKAGPD